MSGIYFDREGREIDVDEWTRRHRTQRYKIIAQTATRGFYVSTVWLGIDHGFGAHDRPIIFETMIFREGSHGPHLGEDVWQDRYATEADARIGHAFAVGLVESGKLE